jgi:hypothetical protein
VPGVISRNSWCSQANIPEHLCSWGCAHREAADPRQLLRSINAAEAALVEPAAGLHIRFRLGGSSFPPILLYKLFTHRPVTGELLTNMQCRSLAGFHSQTSRGDACLPVTSCRSIKPLGHPAGMMHVTKAHQPGECFLDAACSVLST